MHLRMTAIDGTNLRARLKRALVQLEDERRSLLDRYINLAEQEARVRINSIAAATRARDNGERMYSGLGGELQGATGRANSVSVAIHELDEVIELIKEVLER